MNANSKKSCNNFSTISRKHLFFMFGKKTESELSTFRSLLVENFNLASIAKVGYNAKGIRNVPVFLHGKQFVFTF